MASGGKIVAGENVGSYVFVEVDTAGSTGGFFIYRGLQASLDSGFDNWVEKKDLVYQFFRFAGWQIEWLDTSA